MGKMSRQKGKTGEREFRDQLRDAGFLKARRGQQFSGSPDSPDVICPELPGVHFEVKRCESGSLYAWMAQAIGDASKDKLPIVAHRKNNCEWVCILRCKDLLEIIRKSDLVTQDLDRQEPAVAGSNSGTVQKLN